MKIDVYSDMVCPWCKIGKANLSRAIQRWEEQGGEAVEVAYHAFQLQPGLPPEGAPFADVMLPKMGSSERMKQAVAQAASAGAAAGVPLRFERITRWPNTILAHRFAALMPKARQGEAVDALFKAYFEDGQDIARLDVIEAIASGLGPDAEAAAAELRAGGEAGLAAVEADLADAAQIGVTGVPFFVLNGRYALSGAYPPDKLVELMARAAAPEDATRQ